MTRFLVTWRNRSLGRTFDVGLLIAAAGGFAYSYLPGTASVPECRGSRETLQPAGGGGGAYPTP